MTAAGVLAEIGAALLVAQDAASAGASNPVSAAAHWAPPVVTTALLLAAVTIIARMLARRFDKMETTLEVVKDTMPALATKAELETLREQTRASMRSMGDGFDARITKVAERCAVVESDLGKEIAVRQALRDGK